MMCPIKGGDGGARGLRMLLRKICLSFLDTQGCRKGMLSHIHTLFPFSLVDAERKKKPNCLAAFLRSQPGDPEPEPGGREGRGSGFLPPNRQRLPMKRDAVQLDLWGDESPRLSRLRTLSAMDAAQKIQNGLKLHQLSLSFLSFHLIKPNLISILN